jgi:alanine dehydrogenase
MTGAPSFLYLSEAQTRAVLKVPDSLDIVEQAFRWIHSGDALTPDPAMYWLKHRDGIAGSFFSKACYLRPLRVVGYRVVATTKSLEDNSYLPGSSRFLTLIDAATGWPLAIMDEHWTYAVRTGAAAVVAAKHLARRDSRVVSLIGAGRMQAPTLQGLAHAFKLDEVRVFSRRSETREAFAERFRNELGLNVRAVNTPEEANQDADILITATTANEVIVKEADVKPGCFIYAMGLAQELEDTLVLGADKLIMDSWELCLKMADIDRLVSSGALNREMLYAELPAVIAGACPGRVNDYERIVVRSEGLVAHDVAVGFHTYRMAYERQVGLALDA